MEGLHVQGRDDLVRWLLDSWVRCAVLHCGWRCCRRCELRARHSALYVCVWRLRWSGPPCAIVWNQRGTAALVGAFAPPSHTRCFSTTTHSPAKATAQKDMECLLLSATGCSACD